MCETNPVRGRFTDHACRVDSNEKSIRGLLKDDREILREVVEKDEPKTNDWENKLDELCLTMIAKYQPRARDLRTVFMALGMNKDLERMADHAVNIAEDGLYLIERPQVKPLIDIPRMAEEATGMVRDSIPLLPDGRCTTRKRRMRAGQYR